MEPTRRPWGWTWASRQSLGAGERGTRVRLAELQLERERERQREIERERERYRDVDRAQRESYKLRYDWRSRQDIPPNAFYAPNQIRHLIRWEAAIRVPTLPPTWIRDPGRPWLISQITGLPKLHPTLQSQPGVGAAGPDAPTDAPPPIWWESATRGLTIGVALLGIYLLLLWAVDKYLKIKFCKFPLRKRQSEEWPTPSVLATNLTVRMSNEVGAGANATPPAPDPPPPYAAAVAEPKAAEEPPPPYSSCYVTYSNPPDRQPSVHLYTPRHTSLRYGYEEGRSGLLDDNDADLHTGRGDLALGNIEIDEQLRIAVDNGRVLQRIDALDQNLNENDDIPGRSDNMPTDGTVSCEPNVNARLDSVVLINNQRDRFLAV